MQIYFLLDWIWHLSKWKLKTTLSTLERDFLIDCFNHSYLHSQVRIAEGDNTAQYWPNLGSQESAIVNGPVSLFASVKFWADDGGLFRLLNLPTFSRNLAQYRHYTNPIVIFTMASSSESRRARVGLMDGTLLGHVSLLPRQTIPELS